MNSKLRSPRGSYQISEFTMAFVFLIGFVVLPLIDLAVVPLRWGLGVLMVDNWAHQLAMSESLSEARKISESNSFLADGLKRIGGISLRDSRLALTVQSTKLNGIAQSFTKPGSIPKDWLPDGANAPCLYVLDLSVDVSIYPLITAPLMNLKVPGLTEPIVTTFKSTSAWENMGLNPVTGEYFVNE